MKIKSIQELDSRENEKKWIDADELLDYLEDLIIDADDEITVVAMKKVLKGIYECYKD